VVDAIPRYPHTAEELEAAIYADIDNLKGALVGVDELNKVRNRLLTDQLRQLRSNSGLARLLTSYQALSGDWRYLATYSKEIETLTAEDLKVAANKYFKDANRTVVVMKREESL